MVTKMTLEVKKKATYTPGKEKLKTLRSYLLLKLTHNEQAGESNLVLTGGYKSVVKETGSEA